MADETDEIECPYCHAKIHKGAKICAACFKNLGTGEKIDLAALRSIEHPVQQPAEASTQKETEDSKLEQVEPPPSKSSLPLPGQETSEQNLRCPSCSAIVQDKDAVICVQCGRNLKTGDKIQLTSAAGSGAIKHGQAEDGKAMRRCPSCLEHVLAGAIKCRYCGSRLSSSRWRELTDEDKNTIRRISEYYRISGFLWLVIGVMQLSGIILLSVLHALDVRGFVYPVILIPTIFAGMWNTIASSHRFKMVRRVKERDPDVVTANQRMGEIIALVVINFVVGSFIGVLFAALDFRIRDKVLTHSYLF